jgi:hypothetical protein
MKNKIFIFTLLLLTVPLFKIFATQQIPDILIFNGDTIPIFGIPLKQLYDKDSIKVNYFGNKESCTSTACWRGYIANWIIINDHLYLTDIFSCCYFMDHVKANLKKIFGNKYIDGKVKADWVTADIIVPKGEQLDYYQTGNMLIYEKELEFQFRGGLLIKTKFYDNTLPGQYKYS